MDRSPTAGIIMAFLLAPSLLLSDSVDPKTLRGDCEIPGSDFDNPSRVKLDLLRPEKLDSYRAFLAAASFAGTAEPAWRKGHPEPSIEGASRVVRRRGTLRP